MFVNFNILNQLGSPAINSNTFANRPAAGQTGRLFVSTDTFEIYRDNGTSWDLIGGPGSSTITGTGTATQVAYFTSSQAIGSSANLFWDNTSGFLGVATATPTARIEAVKTDGIGIYANYTTNAGSGSSATAIWAKNVTNSSGFAAVIEETTPNATAGQYPLLIKHSLSSGTAGVGMGTGVHWQLPDDAGTFKTTQLTIETINAAAATYATRYRFNVQSNGSSTPVAYINATGLGIFTATPGAALDIHSTGVIAQFNTTSGTGNTYVSFQRTGTGVWRIGDTYNSGANFFGLFNNSISTNAIAVLAATNKTEFTAVENYTTGLARGNYFDYNLNVPAGGSFSSPNAITALTATLDLTLAGSATIPSGARSGLDAYNSIAFTGGGGTLTHNQGTQIRAYSNLTAGWAFNGSAVGTITHLAGLRALFPDNSGSAVNVTNNYALLLNDQTANTGTVTYTNRWGVYQEGASDLNYMAANLLLGSTTNNGNRLQVTGTSNFTGNVGIGINTPTAPLTVYAANNTGAITVTNGPSANNAGITLQSLAGNVVLNNGNGPLEISTGGSLRATLTTSGNLGLGATPSAWGTMFRSLEGSFGQSWFYRNDSLATGLTANTYNNGTNWIYSTTNAAQRFEIGNVGFAWYNAAAGSQGSAITFSQIMTLTQAGRLGVGTSSPSNNFVVSNGGAAGFELGVASGSASGGTLIENYNRSSGQYVQQRTISLDYLFDTNTGTAINIKSNQNVLIGTTTDNGRKLQVNGSGTFTGTGFDSQSAEIQLINTTATTGKTFVLNATNSGGFQVADKTAGGATRFFIDTSGNSEFSGSIKTGAPSGGTAAAWKFGSRVAATVVLSTSQYIELDINGTLYKLAIVT